MIAFDLDADLTPLFNWNTRMLFVFITAEYETKRNKKNTVIIWDRIVQRKDEWHLKLENQRGNRAFWDDGHGLTYAAGSTMQLAAV
eukprot:m.40899 g.40899  ORF g.40899 m.40899 type:complete len:86 (-) comp6022_c0_seq3:218-475(-)